MNAIFRTLGITKQSFHQQLDRKIRMQEELAQLMPIIHQIREDHPRMGAREMYRLINPQTVGRDRFETFCFEHGLKLKVKRNYRKTTNSLGVTRFENLLSTIELNGVNQVWVSDITYYEMGGMFYYLTFITDLFSRRILGYSLSTNLFTESTTIPALKMAFKSRGNINFAGLIFHSDGGGQYYCKEFLQLTKAAGIRNSMCEDVYGNPHAERLNGTIMYNEQKPHKALHGLNPVAYENLIKKDMNKKVSF